MRNSQIFLKPDVIFQLVEINSASSVQNLGLTRKNEYEIEQVECQFITFVF